MPPRKGSKDDGTGNGDSKAPALLTSPLTTRSGRQRRPSHEKLIAVVTEADVHELDIDGVNKSSQSSYIDAIVIIIIVVIDAHG